MKIDITTYFLHKIMFFVHFFLQKPPVYNTIIRYKIKGIVNSV